VVTTHLDRQAVFGGFLGRFVRIQIYHGYDAAPILEGQN
jgi:hypothetical protein